MLLTHKDIRLRALEPSDISLLYEWENNTDFWLDSQALNPYSIYLLNEFVENSHKNVLEALQVRFVIMKRSQQVIGFVDLFDIDVKNGRAAIGILIGEKSEREKGYASQAVDCISEYAFSVLNLFQVYAEVIENNKASQSLFEATGFVKTGIKKDWVQLRRHFYDVLIYQKNNQNNT